MAYFHVVDKLGHELQQDNEGATLITPAWIHIFVRILNHHGLHRQTRRECARLERDQRLAIGGSPFWKQNNMGPPVVDCSPPNVSCSMVP